MTEIVSFSKCRGPKPMLSVLFFRIPNLLDSLANLSNLHYLFNYLKRAGPVVEAPLTWESIGTRFDFRTEHAIFLSKKFTHLYLFQLGSSLSMAWDDVFETKCVYF